MTVTPKITVADGRLVAHGRTILTGVPDNIALTHASGEGLVDGAFVGAEAAEAKSMHVFTFGTLRDLRFMCCFRFKLWWMTQRMGTRGSDVPLETQFMLLESRPGAEDDSGEAVYLVMLPLLEGQFRAALQGNDRDELEITLESGDKAVQTAQAANMVYVHAGTNPFDTITQAVKSRGDQEAARQTSCPQAQWRARHHYGLHWTQLRSLKRQRSGDSFTSMMAEKMDKFAEALKEEAPKGPTSKEILNTLNEVEGLDEDTLLDLFDILTGDARKYESLLALPVKMRKRWLLMKQLKK